MLAAKVAMLRVSVRQIARQAKEKLAAESNVPVAPDSADGCVRSLARELTETLDEVSTGRLFDRFYTVENARGSTGLGLSIAKIFVEKMGGEIGASWSAGRLYIRIRI